MMRGQIRSIEFVVSLLLITVALSYLVFFIPPYAPPEAMAESAHSVLRALLESSVLDEILRNIYDPYYSTPEAIENATVALSQILEAYGDPAYLYTIKIYEVTPSGFKAEVYAGVSAELPPSPSYTYIGSAEVGAIDIRFGGGLSWPKTKYTEEGASGDIPNWMKVLGAPSTNFVVVFTGYVQINETGYWEFELNSDEGAVLEVDGKIVINAWDTGGDVTATIYLEKGSHVIKVYWKQTTGNAIIQLGVSSPSLISYKPATIDNIVAGGLLEVFSVCLGRPPTRPEVFISCPHVVFTRAGVKIYLITVEVGRS